MTHEERHKLKTIKKVLGTVFNRFFIMVLLIMIQFGWIAVKLVELADYSQVITVIFTVISAIMALFVVYRNDNPAYKMGWVLLICLLPVLGATMYLFFGNKRPSRTIRKKVYPVEHAHRDDARQEMPLIEEKDVRVRKTMEYISKFGPYPAWKNTSTRYYKSGEDAFVDMLEDLEKAEHFIFLEYFIVGTGKMWNKIFRILKRKAAAGVDVRFIYDDFGSIQKVPITFAAHLEKNGIKVLPFNPVKPIASLVYNNRDHRKILVVDGYIGYSGGFNLADEYINEEERFGYWKDTGVRLEGDAVWNYTFMFLNLWNAYRKTEDDYSMFRPYIYGPKKQESDGIVQPYSDSPLDDENLGENVYLEIVNRATDYLYIFTPYLIVDSEMMTCLQLASKRGVDVRIVTPAIPDKKIVFRLTRSYYRPLIKAGIRIYEFTPGFIHAKSFISDDKVGVVGSINVDYRSLFLHFECGTLMSGCSALSGLKQDCLDTFDVSKEIGLEDTRTSFIGILFDSVLRLLSPLM
ncbi:MAG TPA: cardiolipin synthase [Candidatus Avanaerovorax faecigallinarum]|nr:cardiolipin synthase [Candidatus Avanaerovorax faecigallinarum]